MFFDLSFIRRVYSIRGFLGCWIEEKLWSKLSAGFFNPLSSYPRVISAVFTRFRMLLGYKYLCTNIYDFNALVIK